MPPQDPNTPATPPALPRGGGATRGLGEEFAVQGFTGRGSFTIPLPTAPGRGALQPELTLSYDSGAGNGVFGLGWRLSIASIVRKTDLGIPRYIDEGPEADIFLSGGAEDLVPFLESNGNPRKLNANGLDITAYRPRVEGNYARTELRKDASGVAHWALTTRDNLTHIFGRSAECRIADPDDDTRVLEWLLEESADDRGNFISYQYKAEDTVGVADDPWEASRLDGSAPFVQRHLKYVRYGNKTPGVSGAWAFQVVFDYGEHELALPTVATQRDWTARKDAFSSYCAGFEQRTYRLCRRVMLFHDFDELKTQQGITPALVRSLEIQYDADPSLAHLTSVLAAGHQFNGASYDAAPLPPNAFEYTPIGQPSAVRTLDTGASLPLAPGVTPPGLWADAFGEGIPGTLLPSTPFWRYKPNQGDGKLGAAVLVQVPESFGSVKGPLVSIDDIPVAGVGKQASDDRWDPFVPFTDDPDPNTPDPTPVTDPDARDDVFVAAGDSIRWARKANGKAEEVRPKGSFREEDSGTELLFADTQEAIFLADMTGDGISDVVRVRNGDVVYWPNLGPDNFAKKIVMGNAPTIANFDPSRVRMADVDRSGTADLVYLGDDQIRICRNLAGNTFADAPAFATPQPFAADGAQIVDLLGAGTCCLVWSSAPNDPASQVQFIALTGDDKPHLLVRTFNNTGREVRVHYKSSTRFFLDDKQANRPWITTLPIPVSVVDRVEIEDLIAGTTLTTTYSYRHGHYDRDDRELRGFALVESRDAETFAGGPGTELLQAPVVTRSWFHTGFFTEGKPLSRRLANEYSPQHAPQPPDSELPDGLDRAGKHEAARALKGVLLRREIFPDDRSALAKIPITTLENSYRVVQVQPAKDKAPAVMRIDLSESLSVSYDRSDGDQRGDGQVVSDPRIEHTLALEVDDFANVLRAAKVCYGRRVPGRPEQAGMLMTQSTSRVLNDVSARAQYRIGLPVEEQQHELLGIRPSGPLWTAVTLDAAIQETSAIPFEASPSGKPERRLLAATRHFYVDEAKRDQDLALGQVGPHALLRRSLRAAFTQNLIDQVYGGRVDATLLAQSAYEPEGNARWWAPSSATTYDPQLYFLPVRVTNAFGRTSSISYDKYGLAITGGTDTLGSQTRAEIDYRMMQPSLIVDANGNRSAVRFDVLGVVVASPQLGKPGANEGDTLDQPTTAIDYDAFAFMRDFPAGKRTPCFVRTTTRERHGAGNTRFAVSVSYADAMGREIQVKTLAEPRPGGEQWVGSGRTIYNNKGNPVQQFQPFFSNIPDYESDPLQSQSGKPVVRKYDALGRVRQIDYLDGTFETFLFDAWSETQFDRNDNVRDSDWFKTRQKRSAGDPEHEASVRTAPHHHTPTVKLLDPMRRAFATIADGGTNKLEARTQLDIQSRVRSVGDALGRVVMRTDYDLLGRTLHTSCMESGERWVFPDVDGQAIAAWDSRNRLLRNSHDELRRARETVLIDGSGPPQVVSRTVYGESQPKPEQHNLRGRVFQIFGDAGVVTNERYDFKGNLVQGVVQFAVEHRKTIDWSLNQPLENQRFHMSAEYDALNREFKTVMPDGTVIERTFNRAGTLERLHGQLAGRGQAPASPVDFVKSVEYDVRGKRKAVVHGNGVACQYEYDPFTFRLSHLTTRDSSGALLQDLKYTYDPVGNVTHIEDGAQQTIYFRNQQVDARNDYTYSPLYRLLAAQGREHLGQAGGSPTPPGTSDAPRTGQLHPSDGNAMGRYTEKYVYDDAGNLKQVVHNGWTRTYQYNETSLLELNKKNNRLSQTDAGAGVQDNYHYDAHGNLDGISHLSSIQWDYADRLHATTRQAGAAGETTFYRYHASGQRARKVTERSDGRRKEERIYLGGGFEVHRTFDAAGNIDVERESIDVSGMVIVETRTKGNDPAPLRLTRFQHGNHLGSVALELDGQGAIISYEEYYPYGSTSYQAMRGQTDKPNRYRYTRQERDDENGFYYNGHRYYASWLGRWISADPAGIDGGINLYEYVGGNPIVFHDRSGLDFPQTDEEKKAYIPKVEAGIFLAGGVYTSLGHTVPLDARARTAMETVVGFCYDSDDKLWGAYNGLKSRLFPNADIPKELPMYATSATPESIEQADATRAAQNEAWRKEHRPNGYDIWQKDMQRISHSVDPVGCGMVKCAAFGSYRLAGQDYQTAATHANNVEGAMQIAATLSIFGQQGAPAEETAMPPDFQWGARTVGGIQGSRFSVSPAARADQLLGALYDQGYSPATLYRNGTAVAKGIVNGQEVTVMATQSPKIHSGLADVKAPNERLLPMAGRNPHPDVRVFEFLRDSGATGGELAASFMICEGCQCSMELSNNFLRLLNPKPYNGDAYRPHP